MLGLLMWSLLGFPRSDNTSDNLRYFGLALQLAGVVLAAIGISDVRREWTARPGIIGITRAWLQQAGRRVQQVWQVAITNPIRRWLGKPPKVISVSTSATLLWHTAAGGRASMTIPAPQGGTLEERVTWLEEHVHVAFQHAENVRQRLTDEVTSRTEAIKAEQAARAEHADEVRRSIGRLAGGGLRLQAWGVLAILAGTILATIPDELVKIG